MNVTQFWIVVCARDLAEAAVAGGYVEVNHGKAEPLERMQPGDGIAFYSPRDAYPHGPPLQAFTAIGRIGDAPIAQSELAHQPFRRAVDWLPATPAPVKPLLDELTFIRNRAYWGAAFRFGFLRVPPVDFARIAQAMACSAALPDAQASAAGDTRTERPRRRRTATKAEAAA
jgi:hypothetical protein